MCRVEAMQQGTEGTERFCIKQLLKPIDNVGCHGVSCMEPLSRDLLQIMANNQAVVFLMLLSYACTATGIMNESWHHVFAYSW